MPSTPVGGADPRRRAHDETRWGVTAAGAPPTVRGLDANAGTGGDGVDGRGSWVRERCEPRASDARGTRRSRMPPETRIRGGGTPAAPGRRGSIRCGVTEGPPGPGSARRGSPACRRAPDRAWTLTRAPGGLRPGSWTCRPARSCPRRRGAPRGSVSRHRLYACAAGGRLFGASVGGDSEEADQCVEGAAPRARRVERVGGTSGGVMPRPGRRRAEGPAARVSAGRSWPVSSSCPSSSRGPGSGAHVRGSLRSDPGESRRQSG